MRTLSPVAPLGQARELTTSHRLAELSLAYNGGKDCLVLLILYLCALHRKGLTEVGGHGRLQSVYIQAPDPFVEVEEFVAQTAKTYSLDLVEYAKPMKQAFADYLQDHPAVKAIFVGTRRTDPHGEFLTHFDPTDHGWPKFMRIHPVIDWHYADIWTVSGPIYSNIQTLEADHGFQFLIRLNIPYCVLYDRGYTSLGGIKDTHPNPVLLGQPSESAEGPEDGAEPVYRPAYELISDFQERLGREK